MTLLEPMHLAALRDIAMETPLEVVVSGVCMAPLIAEGVRLRVQPRRVYWPGDVVVVQVAGAFRVHRLIGWVPGRRGWLLVTQSDAVARHPEGGHDAPLRPEAVLGRVVGGDCATETANISLAQRWRACARFGREVVRSFSRGLQ